MSIPGYQSFMLPALALASDGNVHSAADAIEAIATQYAISPEEREQLLPSGRGQLFYNRVHWALTYLRHARLLESVGRAKFRITERGQDVLRQGPAAVDRKFLMQFEEFRTFVGGTQKTTPSTSDSSVPIPESHDALSPEERLETTYRELRQEVEAELIERLRTCSPLFFERAVLAVLLGMGYGGSRLDAAQHLGKSGDEGLDGVINEDKLGLDKIYVQAKRYKDTVKQSQVREFAGSLDGAHARKGVFITTSTYAPAAREWVTKIDKSSFSSTGSAWPGIWSTTKLVCNARRNSGCTAWTTTSSR